MQCALYLTTPGFLQKDVGLWAKAYVPPEVHGSDSVDPVQVDMYAVGVMALIL